MFTMIVAYASRTGTKRNLAALRGAGWRLLVSAAGRLRTEGFLYGLENGGWSAFTQGRPFDDDAFVTALDRLGAGADFTVLPDIVMGGLRSLEMSLRWLPRVLDATPRALIAVQNGMVPGDVQGFLGPRVGIFVGGCTTWKEQTIGQWSALGREVGCWVHVGRVNTARRIRICTSEGATSFHGSSPSRFAKTVPLLDAARRQLAFVESDQARTEHAALRAGSDF
jgi:hypothetical protein